MTRLKKNKSKIILKKNVRRNFSKLTLNSIAFIFLFFLLYYLLPSNLFTELNNLYVSTTETNHFALENITIRGNKKITDDEVLHISGILNKDNILKLDLNAIYNNLSSYPQIEEVSIRRILPSSLVIKIKERTPNAVWYNNKDFWLIDRSGVIIEKAKNIDLKKNYMIIFGSEGPNNYFSISSLLFQKDLNTKVVSMSFLNKRRWDLYLKDDTVVKLPEENIESALDYLKFFLKTQHNNLSVIDLRLIPDRIFIKYKS